MLMTTAYINQRYQSNKVLLSMTSPKNEFGKFLTDIGITCPLEEQMHILPSAVRNFLIRS